MLEKGKVSDIVMTLGKFNKKTKVRNTGDKMYFD